MSRILRIPLFAIAALVLLPASAGAEAPRLSQTTTAPGWLEEVFHTGFTVEVTCTLPNGGTPDAGTETCTGHLAVRSTPQRLIGTTIAPAGDTRALTTVPVSVPFGETRTVTVPLPVATFRDPVLRRQPLQLVEADLVDERSGTTPFTFALVATWNDRAKGSRCSLPSLVRFTGPGVTVRTRGPRPGSMTNVFLATGDFPVNTTVTASEAPITFTLNGLTYTAAKGTRFELGCSAVGAVRGGAWMPAAWLESGSLTLSGKPTGRQYAATVSTPEGNLGTRTGERTRLVVSRDAVRRIASLKVLQGATGQITPVRTTQGSPCTSGSTLRVDRRGRITRG